MTITALAPPVDEAPAVEQDLNVTATAKAWLAGLGAAGVAVSRRPAVPILADVLVHYSTFEGITIMAFDYQTSVVATVAAPYEHTSRDATAAIPHAWLVRTIKTITAGQPDADVTISTTEIMGQRMALVRAAGYTIPILTHPVADFPSLMEFHHHGTFTTTVEALRSTLNSVSIAASRDDTLPILGAIALEGSVKGLQVMATDRYRLASNRLVVDEGERVPDFEFRLPFTVWAKLDRVLAGETAAVSTLTANLPSQTIPKPAVAVLELRAKGLTVRVLGTSGDYPKIAVLFEQGESATATVGRSELLHQAKVALALGVRNQGAIVKASPTGLSITPPAGDGLGSDWGQGGDAVVVAPNITCDYTHHGEAPDVTTSFNPEYLLAAVQAIKAEKIRLTFPARPGKPVTFTAAEHESSDASVLRMLIMPVRMPS